MCVVLTPSKEDNMHSGTIHRFHVAPDIYSTISTRGPLCQEIFPTSARVHYYTLRNNCTTPSYRNATTTVLLQLIHTAFKASPACTSTLCVCVCGTDSGKLKRERKISHLKRREDKEKKKKSSHGD